MFVKKWMFMVLLIMMLAVYSQMVFAKVDSCWECNVLMDGACLAEKYLPFNQFSPNPGSIKEWSASEGNFFAKDNMIGVRFRLDKQSLETLKRGGFGLEIEAVEIGSHKLKRKSYNHNFPKEARATMDTNVFDKGSDAVHAIIVRNPENLKAGTSYYVWFYFESIPESGVRIQPNLVIDTDSDCYLDRVACINEEERDICEYFQMETDSYVEFTAYSNGEKGVKWSNKEISNEYTPTLYKVDGRWYVAQETNPPDSEDSQNGDDYSNLPSSTTSTDPNASKRKPDLFVKELKFRDGKTKYYDDETIHVDAYAKNSGSGVSKGIKKVAFKLYRFKGEKENGDTKEVGNENIKGENLGSGKTKHEEFSFGVPSGEDKYQLYAVIDAKSSVSESNENNNRFGNLIFRAHKRPNLKVVELTLSGGQTQFEQGEIPSARATFTNTGGEPFQDVPVRWYLDGIHFADDNMRHWNIEHNDQKHEEVNLTQTLAVGSHTIRVCAEFSQDKDQSDNCRNLVFAIVAPVITVIAVDPDPISNSSCEYFDSVKVFHDGLVDNWIVFNPSLAATIKVIGQTSPNNYWSELAVFDGETCFANWPTSATPEFAAYYLDSQGNKQWLDASRCPEHLKDSSDPNDRHFIIRSAMSGSVADSTQFVPGEFCQYFELKKTADTGSRVDYQIVFAQNLPDNLGFIGQSAPNSAWIAYAATNRTVTVSNWPKGQPIEFAVYYFDNQGNKWWLVAPLCPNYFNGSPDPNNQHFMVYLD